jgi:hypothetical protein
MVFRLGYIILLWGCLINLDKVRFQLAQELRLQNRISTVQYSIPAGNELMIGNASSNIGCGLSRRSMSCSGRLFSVSFQDIQEVRRLACNPDIGAFRVMAAPILQAWKLISRTCLRRTPIITGVVACASFPNE